VDTGLDHACALLVTGEIACWGRNRSGQLGDGTTTDRNTPVMVPGLSGVAGLATGHAHTCAFLQDQSVYCWGSNADGQLGVDNNRPSINTPTAVVF
jgi:alpha-tubulin suppressor-like RCC1 family protein